MQFRKPHEQVEVYVLQKIFAIQEVNNSAQSFSVRKGEEIAVSITQEEYERFERLRIEGRSDEFKPDFWMDFFAYNGTEVEWEDPLLTTNGSPYFIREHNGKCICWRQRMSRCSFVEPFELEHFPFDVQSLTMTFQAHGYGNSENTFVLKPWAGGCSYSAKFVEPQGEFEVLRNETHFRATQSQIICTLMIRRNWQFYFYRVMMILGGVTLLGTIAFVMDGLNDQAGHLSTVMLTAIAYLYIVSSYTPVIKYLTLLDIYIYWCVFFTLAIFCQILWIHLDKDLETHRTSFFFANVAVFFVAIFLFALWCCHACKIEIRKLVTVFPKD